jgi:hypothetical protein
MFLDDCAEQVVDVDDRRSGGIATTTMRDFTPESAGSVATFLITPPSAGPPFA